MISDMKKQNNSLEIYMGERERETVNHRERERERSIFCQPKNHESKTPVGKVI